MTDKFRRKLPPSLNHPKDLLTAEERQELYAALDNMAEQRRRSWAESRFLCFGG